MSTHDRHSSHPSTPEAWDARYAERPDRIWSGNPNAVLVQELADLPPGEALDVGCGEGADALWLAERGWAVTGVDISRVALERAAAHAAERGLTVRWQHADLLADPPAAASYDLVTAHFMQLPPPERRQLFAALADAVRPGGTLLLVGHASSDHGREHLAATFYTAGEVAAELDASWSPLVVEARPRQVGDVTQHDEVLRAVRAPVLSS